MAGSSNIEALAFIIRLPKRSVSTLQLNGKPCGQPSEKALTKAIIRLAICRYGYRRITVLLRRNGWRVNDKRAYRIWQRQGLKVPHKQPKRRRLWLNDGSYILHSA